MSLLSAAYEPFYFIIKRFVPDGESGFIPTWERGEQFMATANFPNSSLSEIAAKLTEKTTCTITTSRAVTLEAMDVIQRAEDGVYFRILSSGHENKTPKSAHLDMRQSRAEIWTPPDLE
jgi:hypothetical protein